MSTVHLSALTRNANEDPDSARRAVVLCCAGNPGLHTDLLHSSFRHHSLVSHRMLLRHGSLWCLVGRHFWWDYGIVHSPRQALESHGTGSMCQYVSGMRGDGSCACYSRFHHSFSSDSRNLEAANGSFEQDTLHVCFHNRNFVRHSAAFRARFGISFSAARPSAPSSASAAS